MKNLSEITHELDVVTKKYVDDAAGAKVDKVEGKQLSTNDYTTEEKNKLNSLENYTLPAASADALGGIKIGNNLAIDENGVLNIDDIDYNELENKPTLNGVAITGNMTNEDLGINSSNISYGSGEPEDENAVVWIDPSGNAVSLLTTDNTVEYIPTGDYNPATKKYVDDKVANSSNIIQYLTLNGQQETLNPVLNHIYPTMPALTQGAHKWYASSIQGGLGKETYDFWIESDQGLRIDSTVSTSYTTLSVQTNSSTESVSLSDINLVLSLTETHDSNYYWLNIEPYTASQNTIAFIWDLKTAKNFTCLTRRYDTTSTKDWDGGCVVYGSNDLSTWTPIGTIRDNMLESIVSDKAYRYCKASFVKKAGTRSSLGLRIFYINLLVEELESKYQNDFICDYPVDNLIVKTDIEIPMENVIKNTINNIEIDEVLTSNTFYHLLKYNNIYTVFNKKQMS